jgi:hypothetical protein
MIYGAIAVVRIQRSIVLSLTVVIDVSKAELDSRLLLYESLVLGDV